MENEAQKMLDEIYQYIKNIQLELRGPLFNETEMVYVRVDFKPLLDKVTTLSAVLAK